MEMIAKNPQISPLPPKEWLVWDAFKVAKRHSQEDSTMKWFASLVLLLAILDLTACEGSAQLFGPKKPKIPPQQRVPELIIALKVEKDAHKRADAAEELRQYDVKEFPEIIPVLIDALQNDTATGVRIEAATSLGRIRPVSTQAGQALEKAASGDTNWRVNLQARTSLVYYQLSGYHAPKKNESTGPVLPGRTDEPPLAGANATGGEPWWQNGPARPRPRCRVRPTCIGHCRLVLPKIRKCQW